MEKILSYLSSERNQAKECFDIKPSDIEYSGTEIIELKVSEVHNRTCGGDPDTSPSAGVFSVHIKSCEIKKLNMAEGLYESLGR